MQGREGVSQVSRWHRKGCATGEQAAVCEAGPQGMTALKPTSSLPQIHPLLPVMKFK